MALISTLQDNFDAGSINAALWNVTTTGGFSAAQSGGKLVLTPPTGSSAGGYADVSSKTTYDFTNSSVQVEVDSVVNLSDGSTQAMLDFANSTTEASIYVSGGYIYFYISDTHNTSFGSEVYSSTTHKYWRMRHNSGTIYLDTSPDELSWTNKGSMVTIDSVLSMRLGLIAGANSAIASPVAATFDNLNGQSVTYTVSDRATGGGSLGTLSETASTSISDSASGGGLATTLSSFQSLPQKDYEWRIFDKTGNFIGVWQNVVSDPEWSQSINQNADSLEVRLARSPDNRVTTQTTLQDTSSVTIQDTNGDPILVTSETANSVGSGTDVYENLFADLYVFYGGYDSLLDTNGDPILDSTGDTISSQYGFPNGKRVYSGYIADYELNYGDQEGVIVTVVPHATEQNHIVYKDVSGNTTIAWSSTDPVSMARDAMDRSIADGSIITYDATTMPLSGQTASYTFKLQTTKESINTAVDLLPAGYYSYVGVGDCKQYLLNRGSTADHTFYYEQHITSMKLKKTITQLINDVYFVGGDTGGGVDLYKHYTDATSISTYRRGLERLSDGRVTLAGSAQALSQAKINDYKNPRYTTSVEITDAVYDIETIQLGQMVGFKNFGNFADSLILQIVTLHRKKHSVILDLDTLIPSDAQRLEEIKRRINTEDVSNILSAPS